LVPALLGLFIAFGWLWRLRKAVTCVTASRSTPHPAHHLCLNKGLCLDTAVASRRIHAACCAVSTTTAVLTAGCHERLFSAPLCPFVILGLEPVHVPVIDKRSAKQNGETAARTARTSLSEVPVTQMTSIVMHYGSTIITPRLIVRVLDRLGRKEMY
jgi:hypothetical protein